MGLFCKTFFAVLLAVLLDLPQAMSLEAPALTVPEASDTGYAQLTWTSPAEGQVQYELQSSLSSDFADSRTLYTGRQQGSFLSGLENGALHFRIRAEQAGAQSAWSDTRTLTVRHFDTFFAWLLFGIGAFIVMAITIVIVTGARHHSNSPSIS